jgi:acyl dehydratase
MAVDRDTVIVGTELPPFVRTTGFHNWNRYAAVNDEFVPIHMDDEAGRAQGFEGAFGMGNLMWSYLHSLLREWMGDDGRIVSMTCSFRAPNNRGMTVEARGTVTAVRDEGGERLVDLELAVIDRGAPDTVLVPATATVALA